MIAQRIGWIVGLWAAVNAGAATRYVALDSPNPSPPYTTWATAAHVLQDAVDAAADGDVVLVDAGVYEVGGRNGNRVAVTKPITLLSLHGAESTLINGGSAGRCAYLTNDAILFGFTLTNGVTDCGGGVLAETNGMIINCTITANSAGYGGGSYGGTLYNCTITGNWGGDFGGGSYGGTLYNCTLTANSAGWGGGGGSSGGTLYNCTITGNSAGSY
jgi:parallel beta-helix repeat protein